jgi:hypothetical protein
MGALDFESGHRDLGVGAGRAPMASASEVALMRQKLELVRDVLISLGMQLVFRATILLRRWNY